MPFFCDTHAHLYLPEFDNDRAAMVQRAVAAGVERILLPSIDRDHQASLEALCAQFPDYCFPMIGLHPCSVKANWEAETQFIAQVLAQHADQYYAIGETGLDFYWDLTYRDEQAQSLVQHIEWAKTYDLPIVLHCRNSHAEVFDLICQHYDERLSGVFHCFSGDENDAAALANRLPNFYIGIGGTVTHKKGNQAAVVAATDLAHIVLETDSPYLTPEPFRSMRDPNAKRNESAHIPLIAQKIADIKGISLNEVAAATTRNAMRLFKRIRNY